MPEARRPDQDAAERSGTIGGWGRFLDILLLEIAQLAIETHAEAKTASLVREDRIAVCVRFIEQHWLLGPHARGIIHELA